MIDDSLADDYCAGAGGWDLAATALGIHARGIEIMPEARATRDAAGLTTIHDDVWTFEPDGRAAGQIASPPCPTFSGAGKGSGRKALPQVLELVPLIPHLSLAELRAAADYMDRDERTALVLTPLWFAVHHPYRWLAWEQVPTVLPVWEACAEVLRAQGWNVWTGKLNAEQYGVPQTRTRAKLLASLDHEVEPPAPTHSRYYSRTPAKLDEGVAKWVSMFEAVGWGMTHRPYPTIACSRTSGGPDKEKVGGSAARRTIYDELAAGRWVAMGDVYNSHGCIRPVNAPAPTITASLDNGNFRWKPADTDKPSVRLSLVDAGVLQSFPRDFPWQGNATHRFMQVGNAVPPLLAMHSLSAAADIDIQPAQEAS